MQEAGGELLVAVHLRAFARKHLALVERRELPGRALPEGFQGTAAPGQGIGQVIDPVNGHLLQDGGEVFVIHELLLEDTRHQGGILLQGGLAGIQVSLEVFLAAYALVKPSQEGVVLVPGKLLPGDQFLEIGIPFQQRGDTVPDELEVRMQFLLGRMELTAGCLDAGGSLGGQRSDQGQHVKIQVPHGLAGDFKLRFGLPERHGRILRIAV